MRHGMLRALIAALLCAALALPAGLCEAGDDPEWILPEILEKNGGHAVYTTNDRGVEFLWGRLSDETISSWEDAARVVGQLAPVLGADEWTRLEPEFELQDDNGYHYYAFRQWAGRIAVSYALVKLIVDPAGNCVGLNGYVVPTDSIDYEPAVTEEEARDIVLNAISVDPELAGHVRLTEETGLTIIDVEDPHQGSIVPAVCYIVYTTNLPDNVEFPYLAHYVTASGGYYSHMTPCTVPGDELALSASEADRFFHDYTPETLEVSLPLRDGTKRSVSLDIARDRDGRRCLVDMKRKIVVAQADAYDEDGYLQIEPVDDWQEEDLFMLDAMERCYDFYGAVGWEGADGDGTPILVMNDCLEDGEPVVNAAYVSKADGWQMFAISRQDAIPQCLDIIGHEYTHCVLDASMSDILYSNEQGAINEALADIMGNIMEMLLERTDDVNWMIGECSDETIRCMSTPRLFQQPAFVGGEYYVPSVTVPQVTLNDMGGVHVNSSLLNLTCVQLWQAGMSLEELQSLYTTLICMLIPTNGFLEISRMFPAALSMCDLGGWTDRAATIISEIGLDTDGRTLLRQEAGCGKLTFTLPEIENVSSGAWILEISSTPDDGEALLGEFRSQMEDDGWTLFPEDLTLYEEGEEGEDPGIVIAEAPEDAPREIHHGGRSYYSWPDRNTGTITLTALEGDYTALLLNATDTAVIILTWDGRQWTDDLFANGLISIRSGQLTSLNTVGIADAAQAIVQMDEEAENEDDAA